MLFLHFYTSSSEMPLEIFLWKLLNFLKKITGNKIFENQKKTEKVASLNFSSQLWWVSMSDCLCA